MNRRSPVFGGTAASLFLIIVAAVAVVGCTENGIAAGAAGDPLGPEWGRGSSSSTAALNAGRVGRLLATTNNNPDPTGTILKVDPVTGAGTFVAELEDPTNALAYSTVEGVLYGSMLFGDAPPRSSRLVRIDPLTGAIDPVGLIRNRNDAAERFQVTAMGFDGANLFGFGPADELLDIDPATGLARVVGAAGFDLWNTGGKVDAESFWILAKNRRRPDGTLFPPKDREVTLFRADLGTGAATLVGGTGLFENGMGVAVGPLDDLLGVNNNTLYRFDRITAVPTLIGPVGFDAVSGLEFLDLQGRVESQCMCSGPQPSVFWKGHGEFMACVSHASTELMRDGLISGAERGRIVREAARSECGK